MNIICIFVWNVKNKCLYLIVLLCKYDQCVCVSVCFSVQVCSYFWLNVRSNKTTVYCISSVYLFDRKRPFTLFLSSKVLQCYKLFYQKEFTLLSLPLIFEETIRKGKIFGKREVIWRPINIPYFVFFLSRRKQWLPYQFG